MCPHSSLLQAPFYTIYGATKAFVEWFSTSMSVELWSSGVTMHAHIPLYVVTKMGKCFSHIRP